MRTTVNFEEDVWVAVERRRRELGSGLSEAVNDLVRVGLLKEQNRPKDEWVMPKGNLGEPLIDITDIGEALEIAEGPDHR